MADTLLNITLLGTEELKDKLEKIRALIQDHPEASLIAKAAYAVQRQVQINATGRPGPRVQTGQLRSSITAQIESYDKATIGTNVYYAPFVEFGHKQQVGRFVPIYGMRRIGKGEFKGRYEVSQGLGLRLVNPFAPAYPFFSPAIEQCKPELEGICVTFGREIEGEFSK